MIITPHPYGRMANRLILASHWIAASKWTSVMNDTIHTGLPGHHTCKISQLAAEMYGLHVAAKETGK